MVVVVSSSHCIEKQDQDLKLPANYIYIISSMFGHRAWKVEAEQCRGEGQF